MCDFCLKSHIVILHSGSMTTATEMLATYTSAELAVLQGQSFELAGRKLTRADLVEIRAGRQEWERKVLIETRKASGTSRVAHANFSGCDR